MFSKEYVAYVKNTYNQAYTVEMAACALIGELLEVMKCKEQTERIDELGDVYYQYVLFVILTGFNFEDLKYKTIEQVNDTFIENIISITDQFKKQVTRKIAIKQDVIMECLSNLYSKILELTIALGFTSVEVEEYNIAKLNKRYENVHNER